MNCTISDINLSFDKDYRVRTSIMRAAAGDMNKAVALTAILNDDDFKKFLFKSIADVDVIKSETIDFDNFTNEDYVKLNQNKLSSLLNQYYIEHYFSVNNSKTNKALGRLNGFSSGSAKNLAKNYTATLLVNEYLKEVDKPKKLRRKPEEIVRDVNKILLDELYDSINKLSLNIEGTDKYSKEAKAYVEKYKALIDKINKLNKDYDDTKDAIDNAENDYQAKIKERKELLKDPVANKQRLLSIFDELTELKPKKEKANADREAANDIRKEIIAKLERDRLCMAYNMIDLYTNNVDGNIKKRLKNFANLVAQSRGDANAWYFQVFNTKKMTSIIKAFNNISNLDEYLEDQEDGDSIDFYNEESIDETAKTWEDSVYGNFNKAVNGRLRIILSSIHKLNKPYNYNSKIQSYDTNNDLGVSTFMDAQYLTVQIFSFGDFSSVPNFIKSLERISNNVKELYGLGELVAMMKNKRHFANYVFANFAKPIGNRTMLTITNIANSEGIKFDYSNPTAFANRELSFRLINKIRSTYSSSYDHDDIKILNNISNDSIKLSVDLNDINARLFEIVNKYFPNFNKDVFNNYFNNISKEDNYRQEVQDLVKFFIDTIKEVGKFKEFLLNKEEEFDKAQSAIWEKYKVDLILYESDKKKYDRPKKPIRQYFSPGKYDLSKEIYKNIFQIAKEISKYSDSRARLNDTNAEGNSSSSVLKNCYITRFFELIRSNDEALSRKGLENLYKYITQGTENGATNQYSNNVLFFGLRDENGVLVKQNGKPIFEGMFDLQGGINPNAKEILNYSLFDGTKNTEDNNGAGYAKMSKLDFFLTQFMAFRNSVNEFTEQGTTKKIGNVDSAVYSMRIGSDAPKIFFIRAPRFNNAQIADALYNQVINELNMFCKGLNCIFKQEGNNTFRSRTDINNLIGRALFDEKAANKMKQKGEINFTKAITDGTKLLGNIFKFNRLFDVNGYSANADIMNIISLYGEGNTSSLVIPDQNGRLKLNQARIEGTGDNSSIIWKDNHFEINLSTEQKNALKEVVNKWMINFLKDAKSRTTGFLTTLDDNEIKYSNEEVDSFLLNAANMNMIYDDLFEGDFKFYNNARDFLKRTKESQAGGDGYAAFDLTEDPLLGLHELTWNNQPDYINVKKEINGQEVQYEAPTYENGTLVNKAIVARNGFRAITVYNTQKASDYADEMQKVLEEQFIKDGMNPKVAKERSNIIASGYGYSFADVKGDTTKINDAQSYITLEEFIRRKYADGTIDQYQDLLAQLLDDSVNVEDINLEEINTRIQVQKNFYFDIIYDPITGLYYPRQIKNAEFVLIPKLLPRDSDLAHVYEWMKENDIGQLNTVETSKAAKKNILTIWDANIGEYSENYKTEFDESYVEDYYYKNLYKQQDVPEHMVDAQNKAGTQIMKKIIDNIISENDATDEERQKLVKWANEYQDAYTANIREDFHGFLTRMGWEYDEESGKIVNSIYKTTDYNGNPLPESSIEFNRTNLNFDNFYKRAREEAARLGMDSNFIEYLIPEGDDRPKMPNSMNTAAAKLESIAQAIYNSSITRQTLPGWHGAQITGVGYSRKLNFDAETGVMEVFLPRWSKLIPKGKNPEEDAAILKQIQEEGLDIHIGYRIPTEGKQSISILKVVGFTNECLGSTIVVPEEWVTQTGSDFDVDSVYGISWEMYKTTNKEGKIELHKVPYEENKVEQDKLYVKYVKHNVENITASKNNDELHQNIEDDIKEEKDRLNAEANERKSEREAISAQFDKVDDLRNDLYPKLPKWAMSIIAQQNAIAKKKEKKDKVVTDLRDSYTIINQKLNTVLEKNSKKSTQEEIDNVKTYIDYETALIDIMNQQEGLPGFDREQYKSIKAEIISTYIEQAKQEYFDAIEQDAIDNGLLSYDEWKQLPFVEKLDKKARNNYILSRMLNIMEHGSSREEQYGRSNFDDITNGNGTGANDIINVISGEKSRVRSPYSPLDQLDYFEDAMGGAKLKALSVNWDTFSSKINRIRAILSPEDAITVELTLGEKSATDSVITYNEEQIKLSYGDDVQIMEQEILSNSNDNINSIAENWSKKEGWSIDYFNKNVLPQIESGNAWQIEYKLAPQDAKESFTGRMSFDYGYNKRPDVKSKSTIEAIRNGERTSTTRYTKDGHLDYWQKAKVGDIIKFYRGDKNGNDYVKVIVTKPLHKIEITNKTESTLDKTSKKVAIFTANKVGWSNNNRNLVGRLCTVYTSETTAHHLDAVKMGSVPNVDEYTFKVYKLLSTLGIDYENVIGFIRQPVITRLVNNNNLINSVFFKSSGRPLQMTVFNLVKDLKDKEFLNIKDKKEINKIVEKYNNTQDIKDKAGLNPYNELTPFSRLSEIIEVFKGDAEFVDYFNRFFNINISNMSYDKISKIKIPLNKEKLFGRIKNAAKHIGNVKKNAAFDLGIILTFSNLQKTANKIDNYINVTNIDKEGTRNTIRATRNIVDKVNDLRSDMTFSKEGIPLIDVIYPTDENGNILVDQSAYKSIAACYAYATVPSVQTNTILFETENKYFADAEKFLQKEVLHHKLNDSEYKEYKRFFVSYIYNRIPKLLSPIKLNDRGVIEIDTEQAQRMNVEPTNALNYWNLERSRICGYNITTDGDFTPENLNKPTDNDIEQFSNLTPAQKVMFIQRHFPDDQGIFNNIKVTLYNNDSNYRGVTRQYLAFDDQVEDIEDLFNMFTNSFANHNKLIKLAAVDLIKYAFIAEGFNFRSSYISKIIPNDTLYTSAAEGGMDIIDQFNRELSDAYQLVEDDTFRDIYVRSHSSLIPITRLGSKLAKYIKEDGLVYLDTTTVDKNRDEIISKANIAGNINGYVRLNFYSEGKAFTRLYKVKGYNESTDENSNNIGYKDYVLIPLNLLDTNETYEISYNERNNIFNDTDYYKTKAEEMAKTYEIYRALIEPINNMPTNTKEERIAKKDAITNIKANTIFKITNTYNPIGAFSDNKIDVENPNLLEELYYSPDDRINGPIKRLVNNIRLNLNKDINRPYIQFNMGPILETIIPKGNFIEQTINLDSDSSVDVTIANLPQKKVIDEASKFDTPKGNKDYITPITDMNNSFVSPKKANFYRVTRTKKSKEELNNLSYNAITDMVIDEDVNFLDGDNEPARKGNPLTNLSRRIIIEANKDYRRISNDDYRKTDNRFAEAFIKNIKRKRINTQLSTSLQENKEDIYKYAARYYQSTANAILNKLESVKLGEGNDSVEYSMGDKNLYKYLIEHDEYFGDIAKVLLDGITFGNVIKDIFSLDLTAEDEETKKNIESIIHSINKVRQSKLLSDGMKYIMNIYFAKYSTNPDIINGIMELRETFGDIDTLDKWIADPADMDNNQTQIILKKVYSIINKAELFDAKKNVQEWKERLADIQAIEGTMDISHVIDNSNGTLHQAYNDQFILDRRKVIDNLSKAIENKDNSFEDYKKYVIAKYERDKFMYENTVQQIQDDYYRRDLELRYMAMNLAGNNYYKYLQLRDELYNTNVTAVNNSEESDSDRRKKIRIRMNDLQATVDTTGTEKEGVAREQAKKLQEFIKAKKALNEEYFTSQEYDGFKTDYKRYKSIVDRYDARHKEESLTEKLENSEYKEAYNWIKNNSITGIDREHKAKLDKAFDTLVRRKKAISINVMTGLKNIPGVVDEVGNIDPRKLNDAQLQDIRNSELSDLSKMYDNSSNEMILIKDVSEKTDLLNIDKVKQYDKSLAEMLKYTDNATKVKVITRINQIISKAFDKNTGRLDYNMFFNNDIISDAERNELIGLYNTLRSLRSEKFKLIKNKKNKVYTDAISGNFVFAQNYYRTNLINTKQGTQFNNIFMEWDEDGNLVPNHYIFGYKKVNEEFIDTKRTDARKFIDDNVEFITTEYYDLALEEAKNKGIDYYNEWFAKNHIYDTFTHKYRPLKIWTTMVTKPGSELSGGVTYLPTFDNMDRFVKDGRTINGETIPDLRNPKYNPNTNNFKLTEANKDKYANKVELNKKEEALRQLIEETLNKYSKTHQSKRFFGQGYMPREISRDIDASYLVGQLGSLMGFNFHSGADSDKFTEAIDYAHDRDADMPMAGLIKGKGTKRYKHIPQIGIDETQEQYNKRVAEIRKENEEIKVNNEKIDSAMLSHDWINIMERFIHNATIFNAQQSTKPYLYLLLEDLQNTEAYMVKGMWNKRVVEDSNSMKDSSLYRTTNKNNITDIVRNQTRRLIYSQYHENGMARSMANFLQNMTSAKYMIFNLYGGIANITTGKVNIAMEEYAREYFGAKEFMAAQMQYLAKAPSMVLNMYSDKAPNRLAGLIKFFDIVDFDQMLQFGEGSKGLDKNFRRVRNLTYSQQSAGEHYMQNSVLIAMLSSNRLYTDSDGVQRIGDFKDFTWDVEKQAMRDILEGNEELQRRYNNYLEGIKYDIEDKANLVFGKTDFNRRFLNTIKNSNKENAKALYKETVEKYIKRRKELLELRRKDFNANPTVNSLFDFKNGEIVLKQSAIDDFNSKGRNKIGDLEDLISDFREKVISVNKKIHGVYDKKGAAYLEHTWYGSLVMQYHKHLYTGIMKRWRRKGFYSEFRGSKERGSYQTLIDFLGTEFLDFHSRAKNKDANIALASIQVTIESIYNTLANVGFNWQLLSEWERANIRRNLGDCTGVVIAVLVTMALYGAFDDDEINDDKFRASLLYLADRLYSDSTMYSPVGLVSEYKTAWSSPIASANGPSDLVKATMLIPQALFDPEYNPNYQTGQYAGKNKFEVLLRRNIPGVRPYDRIMSIDKNNEYYKIGQSQIGINIAKSFADILFDD